MLQVYISLVLEIVLAIGGSIFTALAEHWPLSGEESGHKHASATFTALVEFHKHQCVFVTALQAATILLGTMANRDAFGGQPLDLLVAMALVLNGVLPVTLTLMTISHFGRLSWYILVLSILAVAMSTGSLALTRQYWNWLAGWSRFFIRPTLSFRATDFDMWIVGGTPELGSSGCLQLYIDHAHVWLLCSGFDILHYKASIRHMPQERDYREIQSLCRH